MSNGPEPGPESLELPLFARPIARIGAVGGSTVEGPGFARATADGPGVLRPFGGVLDVWARTVAGGWAVPPTLAYLVLRPLVVTTLRDAGDRRSSDTPVASEAPSTGEGSTSTDTRVYEVLREASVADGTTGERVRSWRPPGTTVARRSPVQVLPGGSSDTTPTRGPARASSETGFDRSDRRSPRTGAGGGRSGLSTPGRGRLPTASGPVADARSATPVGRPPTLLVRRAPGAAGPGEDDGPLAAPTPSRLAVGGAPAPEASDGPGFATRVGPAGDPGTSTPVPGVGPGPGETSSSARPRSTPGADATGRPRDGSADPGRRGDGRPPMEVRRTSTAGRAGESRERAVGEAGRPGGSRPRVHTERTDSPSPDGTNGRSPPEADGRVSIDRLLEDPGSVGRLVDRLHRELDRKRRRERERRGL